MTSLAAFAFVLPSLLAAQVPSDECRASEAAQSLCAAEAMLTGALRRNDVDALARIYADEFQLVNYRGTRVDRAAVLAAVKTGALRFDSLTTSGLVVRVYGITGVISGVQHQVAREPGGDLGAEERTPPLVGDDVLHSGPGGGAGLRPG
jgi:Domain of unknown function (DUF4440)